MACEVQIPQHLIPTLEAMRVQLVNGPGLRYRLEATDDPNVSVRAVIHQNPCWYREMVNAFTSSHPNKIKRLARTKKHKYRPSKISTVRRQDTIHLLGRMIKSKTTYSKYGIYLLEVAQERSQMTEQEIYEKYMEEG